MLETEIRAFGYGQRDWRRVPLGVSVTDNGNSQNKQSGHIPHQCYESSHVGSNLLYNPNELRVALLRVALGRLDRKRLLQFPHSWFTISALVSRFLSEFALQLRPELLQNIADRIDTDLHGQFRYCVASAPLIPIIGIRYGYRG